MKVKEVMTTVLITANKEAPYKEVAEKMIARDVSGILIVDDQGLLVGLVSEKDLFRILYPYYQSFYERPEEYKNFEEREEKIKEAFTHPVEKFMAKNLITVSPETPIMEAGATMLAKKIHRLPVVENGKLIGIVTRKDIYHAILNSHLK